MPVLAIDYGTKFNGIAISDSRKRVATPLSPIITQKSRVLIKQIDRLITKYNVELIILGHPTGFKNAKTSMSKKVEDFKAQLESSITVDIKLWNEAFTSFLAHKTTNRSNPMSHSEAARIMLQEYLDHANLVEQS